ncbi:MAG: helix-turn-helix transcriptional regulator [Alphaproteobacteria bacterium]|nr:helix-turn-helix transcriptional regulator [Alphaproteobacteria bacterium]
MVQKNILSETPPYAVENSISLLAKNLKTARLRRNLTLKEVAEKIGTGVKVIHDAEQGKTTTSIVVYFALLWAYDLLQDVKNLADPLKDETGLRLMESIAPQRSNKKKMLDNDF